MRACCQRVSQASVTVAGDVVSEIQQGMLVLLGVEKGDSEADAKLITDKLIGLRIFDDQEGKMNLALADVGGSLLLVSQFTLCGDARKGRRPSFINAADPGEGERLYEEVVKLTRQQGISTQTGRFQTHMQVRLINDGPVTILLDSRKVF